MTRIEHLNITVPNIDEAIDFIKIVAPDFEVRKDSQPSDSYRWVHIGNEDCYFALQEAHLGATPEKRLQPYRNYGINHVALVVSDVEVIEKKLIDAGYQKGIDTPIEKYRKRIYYLDNAGFEWELVEYLSEKPSEKYLYE
jgi:catechol 2,3-dioxygenase-like lactoylglutathione lyase family enzyme